MPLHARNFEDGQLTGREVATVADLNTVGGIPIVYRVASAAAATVAVVVAQKIRVIDVEVVATIGTPNGTVQVKNGATAITDAIACDTDKAITKAGTIDDAQHEIAAGGTMNVVFTTADVGGIAYIKAVRVA